MDNGLLIKYLSKIVVDPRKNLKGEDLYWSVIKDIEDLIVKVEKISERSNDPMSVRMDRALESAKKASPKERAELLHAAGIVSKDEIEEVAERLKNGRKRISKKSSKVSKNRK